MGNQSGRRQAFSEIGRELTASKKGIGGKLAKGVIQVGTFLAVEALTETVAAGIVAGEIGGFTLMPIFEFAMPILGPAELLGGLGVGGYFGTKAAKYTGAKFDDWYARKYPEKEVRAAPPPPPPPRLPPPPPPPPPPGRH